MPDPKSPVDAAPIYPPETLQRLISVLWNSREEPRIQSVLLYVVLGAFAGLRPAEAVDLEWKQVDWAKREIRVGAGETTRTIPIKENLWTFLVPHKGRNGPAIIHKKVANLLRNECTRAGVAHISNGLRRSYGAYRLGEVPEEVVRSEMGLDPSQHPERKEIPAAELAKYWAVCP